MDFPIDQIKCPYCLREVPLLNKDLHIARCQRRKASISGQSESRERNSVSVICIDDGVEADDNDGTNNAASEVVDLLNDPSSPLAPIDGFHAPMSPGLQPMRMCSHCSLLNSMDARICSQCRNTIERWQCLSCTFLNSSSAVVCEMCNEPTQKLNYSDDLSSDVNSDMDIDNMPQSNGWSCSVCTFLNDGSRHICEMCGQSDRLVSLGSSGDGATPLSSMYEMDSSESHMLPATVFGGLIGAGTAYMGGRNVLDGAVQGAGLGMMGGMLLDQQAPEMRERYTRSGMRRYAAPRYRAREGVSGPHFMQGGLTDDNFGFNYNRVFMGGRAPLMFQPSLDIDNMDYEQLYSR